MKTRLMFLAATALAAFSTAANATTINFSYNDGANTSVASGSFSYATGSTGVLGYGDLTAFSVTLFGSTYNLAAVLPLTDYVHFAYDTAANSFVVDPNSCGFSGCGFQSSLSAINSSGSFGFFFNGAPGGFAKYDSPFASGAFQTITFTNAVPEPASWALMIAGFGLVGAAARRRQSVRVTYA